MDAVRIQSKFLVVSPTRILSPAQLVVRRGRVVEVTSSISQTADIDLEETVLIPGLINAHTHLEFSSLDFPFATGKSFPEWIAQVVNYRRKLSEATMVTPTVGSPDQPLKAAISIGLHECFKSGSVLLGDIVTPPWQPNLLPDPGEFRRGVTTMHTYWAGHHRKLPPKSWQEHFSSISYPRVVAFAELLGLQTARMECSWQWASELLPQPGSELLRDIGLSPHAPYSIHFPALVRWLTTGSREVPLAMHLAESPAEMEWLNVGSGPFKAMFQSLGIAIETPAPSIEQCIELLSGRQRSLLIHGNYLTKAQMERVAAAKTISVVFCPRTHAHFGHAPYPLKTMLDAGLSVMLATDSRASNPSLSLWDEVVEVRRIAPHIPPSDLLDWVTLCPARALGLERDFGSLDVGKLAYVSVTRAEPRWTTENLLEEMSRQSQAELKFQPLSNLLHRVQ